MKIIDTHTHISSEDFESDRAEVLSRALEVCDYLIDIGAGTSGDAHRRACEFSEAHDAVYFTAGVHPHDAESLGTNSQQIKEIEDLLKHPKCVALGECGLDYFYNHSDREIQKQVFSQHIQIAQNEKIPLMIHTRDAEEDTKELLKNFEGTGVFHCFTGSQDLAHFGVQKGFMISFSGIVTFKKATELQQCFLSLPLENILIETDAPYLAPTPLRGKRNEPSFIQHTAEFLADLRDIPTDDFIQQTSANALRLFKKIRSTN